MGALGRGAHVHAPRAGHRWAGAARPRPGGGSSRTRWRCPGIEDRDGELTLKVRDSRWADALYSFVRVAGASYVFTEQVKS